MSRRLHLIAPCLLGLVAISACSDPTEPSTITQVATGLEDCAVTDDWLPDTPPLTMYNPLPHPATECPFYRGAWQNFLYNFKPDANGQSGVVSLPTIDDVFQSSIPHGLRNTASRAWLGVLKQAGARQIAIDQNGHTLYYGIHMNQAFVDFLNENGLTTPDAITDTDPSHAVNSTLFFPPGLAEFKTAWQEVDGVTDASDPRLQTFIATQAWVPTIHQDPTTKAITWDANHPMQVWVRLLAIHSVYTLPGHPEFIWGSLEHTDVDTSKGEFDAAAVDGHRDVAPIHPGDVNPDVATDPSDANDPTIIDNDPSHSFVMYKTGTKAQDANHGPTDTGLNLVTQADGTQVFQDATTGAMQSTNVFRLFPASKSVTVDPDDAVTSLNHNVENLFTTKAGVLAPGDMRGHYRLIGGQWMDKPHYFTLNANLENDDKTSPFVVPIGGTHIAENGETVMNILAADYDKAIAIDGTDDPFSITAGEDRMSSTVMETFSQDPNSFPNCLACHNTQAVTPKGAPPLTATDPIVVPPRFINVSHILNEFVLDDEEECADAVAAGTAPAVCPTAPPQYPSGLLVPNTNQ